jgi:UDP-3-O-[3-hydroxymyristoyl] N-acetylglucosamine deacetylase
VCFVRDGVETVREHLRIVRADHGVRVDLDGHGELDLVEHLCAAFGGLGVRSGIRVEAHGPELPILDGGAADFARALRALSPPRERPLLTVVQAGDVIVGRSRYSFEPRESVEVGVEVEFAGVGAQRARWYGNSTDFLERIAPARTFGYRSSAEALRREGRARHVDPRAVIVLEDDGTPLAGSPPLSEDELARHKLLDLIGDLWLFGGPPLGQVVAWRPGHQANHQAIRLALTYGLVQELGRG